MRKNKDSKVKTKFGSALMNEFTKNVKPPPKRKGYEINKIKENNKIGYLQLHAIKESLGSGNLN